MQKTKKSEAEVIQVFGDLVSIMNYSDMVLSNYAVTTDQIRGSIARNMERLTAEFLPLEAVSLIDKQSEPTPNQLEKQFQAFKSIPAGNFSEDNPYGFGYLLGQRIRLEYFLINMDDVKERIDKPTPEQLESYYSRHLSKYQRSEPIDPNNPDAGSQMITRPFAQVVNRIRQDIVALGKQYNIQEIGIDRWGSQQIQTQLSGDGF